jgi:quercetin dioxygenase-like cupin family protein
LGVSSSGRSLARTPSLYVAAVLGGRAYLVLETCQVLLETGDSFVLPGALHAWRNPFEETAVMLATVVRLAEIPNARR